MSLGQNQSHATPQSEVQATASGRLYDSTTRTTLSDIPLHARSRHDSYSPDIQDYL